MNETTVDLAQHYARIMNALAVECERMMRLWDDRIKMGQLTHTHEHAQCWKIVKTVNANGVRGDQVAKWKDDLDYVIETAEEAISQ